MKLSKGRWFLGTLVGLCIPFVLAAADATEQPGAAAGRLPKLSATQIVEKFYAARGGLAAWRAVQTMSWNGKMEAGFADSAARSARYVSNAAKAHNARSEKEKLMLMDQMAKQHAGDKQVELPFLLEMKRPNKQRLELEFNGKTAIQLYDGASGWLKRPYLNRDDWEPFSAQQAKIQAAEPGLDGLLFDYEKRGTKLALEGVEPVDGHEAYKLKLTMASGEVRHVWIDGQSFLDVRVEGTPRRMDGVMHTVWVYQRDFRPVQGLQMPFALETVVQGYPDAHKMTIEKVALNPQLDDSKFVRPKS